MHEYILYTVLYCILYCIHLYLHITAQDYMLITVYLYYKSNLDQMQLLPYALESITSALHIPPSYSWSEGVRQVAFPSIILIWRMHSKILFASIYLFAPCNLHCNYHLGLVRSILHWSCMKKIKPRNQGLWLQEETIHDIKLPDTIS